jgi:transcription elongation GreA/GreB family factor
MKQMNSQTIAPRAGALPITPEAFDAVRTEVASLRAAGGDADLDARRLPALLAAIEAGRVELDPDVAAVGRRVVVALRGGSRDAFRLVLPGDGEPDLGWISIDAPLGAALAGGRAGDQVLVDAPGGAWSAVIVEVR